MVTVVPSKQSPEKVLRKEKHGVGQSSPAQSSTDNFQRANLRGYLTNSFNYKSRKNNYSNTIKHRRLYAEDTIDQLHDHSRKDLMDSKHRMMNKKILKKFEKKHPRSKTFDSDQQSNNIVGVYNTSTDDNRFLDEWNSYRDQACMWHMVTMKSGSCGDE
jgi:hypothetical protein